MVALFVALMFVGFVFLDHIVQSLQVRRAAVSAPSTLSWNVPAGFSLAEGHTWSSPDSRVGVKVGADALLAHAVGSVQEIGLPKLGELVKSGELLFHLKCHGHELKIPSFLTGRVVALNPRLAKHPGLVVSDPYGSGWICAITPTETDGRSQAMRLGEKAAVWLEQEFHRFREFLSRQVSPDMALSVTYPDGGLPAVGALNQLARSGWLAFEAEFLCPKSSQ